MNQKQNMSKIDTGDKFSQLVHDSDSTDSSAKSVRARQKKYWQQKLGENLPVLELPSDYPRSSLSPFLRK
ncbi:MAG: hypothetical protein D3923_18370, partial [Candidatus Electrothrix sp. AR3]|nr:hypothetical protein [Candidatus Electrothrix sp. AR3]